MLATLISAITIALPLMIVQSIPLDSKGVKFVKDVRSGTLKAIPTYQQGVVNTKGLSIDTADGLLSDERTEQYGSNGNNSSIENEYETDSSEEEEDSTESETASSETPTSSSTGKSSVSALPLPTPMPPPVKLLLSPSPSPPTIPYPNALMSCRCLLAGSLCTTDLASESMVCEPNKRPELQKPICFLSCCSICLIRNHAGPCQDSSLLEMCRNEYFKSDFR